MNSGRREKILLAKVATLHNDRGETTARCKVKLGLSAADLLAVSLSSPFSRALQLNISDSFLRARS